MGQSEATLLTSIDQIDRLYVNFDRPADETLQLRAAQARGEVTCSITTRRPCRSSSPDGTPYLPLGTLDFDDVSVDPTMPRSPFAASSPIHSASCCPECSSPCI
ncbi:MAG: hypothetical protein WDM77_19850 [Steroidobacteraceae bacterium]